MPVLPPPRREVDLPAAEKLIADLQAAGIDACEMADLTGAVDFVTKGRAVLELHSTLLSQGQRVTDVAVLLRELENLTIESRHDAGAAAISPGVAVGPNGKWIAVFEPQTIDLNPAYESGTREATIAIDGVPIAQSRDRPEQRAAKKSRARTKARRGY